MGGEGDKRLARGGDTVQPYKIQHALAAAQLMEMEGGRGHLSSSGHGRKDCRLQPLDRCSSVLSFCDCCCHAIAQCYCDYRALGTSTF